MTVTRTTFIPSRNSQHRIAAIALYRALVKAAHAVPIRSGDHVRPETRRQLQPPAHPLANIVRRRFDRNKWDVSLRLVYASMSAGYKFLTLLVNARTPSHPDHARILDILRAQQKLSASSRTLAASRSPTTAPRRKRDSGTPPLLVNRASPGERPRYEASPRARDAFTGSRRVPSLASISEGFPFLRYTKPQPRDLSAMIGKRRTRWIKLTDAIRVVEDESGPDATLEDQWEHLIAQQMAEEAEEKDGQSDGPRRRRRQGTPNGVDVRPPRDVTESFLWSATLKKLWAEHKLDMVWEDWNARGEALYALLKAERALAEREGEAVRPQRFGSAPTLTQTEALLGSADGSATASTPQARSLNIVESTRHAPTLQLRRDSAKRHGYVEGETHDFFATPVWADIVEGSRVRMLKWMRSTAGWDWAYVAPLSGRDASLLNNGDESGPSGKRRGAGTEAKNRNRNKRP